MSVHTQKHPTEVMCTLAFMGPLDQAQAARDALHALGFTEEHDTVSRRECFPAWSEAQLPGVALAGARYKEGVTQMELAWLTGIPQCHISEMEHGKRPIGKKYAKKFAKALQIDYHVFL